MRHVPTDAEAKMWLFLRDRRLAGWRFRRQHFVADHILDFYCPEGRLAVELDGGGHADDDKIAADARRTAALQERGIRLLRFWHDQALRDTDTVLEMILRALEQHHPSEPSPPTPLPVARPSPQPLSLPGRGEKRGD
jgi:very-short-patch-repair endonuclease